MCEREITREGGRERGDRKKQWNISRALNLCVLFSNPVGLNLLWPFRMWPFLNSPHNFSPYLTLASPLSVSHSASLTRVKNVCIHWILAAYVYFGGASRIIWTQIRYLLLFIAQISPLGWGFPPSPDSLPSFATSHTSSSILTPLLTPSDSHTHDPTFLKPPPLPHPVTTLQLAQASSFLPSDTSPPFIRFSR